jgi:hypothetical protein
MIVPCGSSTGYIYQHLNLGWRLANLSHIEQGEEVVGNLPHIEQGEEVVDNLLHIEHGEEVGNLPHIEQGEGLVGRSACGP